MSIVERERVETEVAPVTTKEVLHRAADLLEEFGWCQRFAGLTSSGEETSPFSADASRFCALGAYARAKTDLGAFTPKDRYSFYALEDELVSVAGIRYEWNDEDGRTKSEVVTKFRNSANAL